MSCHKNEKKFKKIPPPLTIFYQTATGSTGIFLGLNISSLRVLTHHCSTIIIIIKTTHWYMLQMAHWIHRLYDNALSSDLYVCYLLRSSQHYHQSTVNIHTRHHTSRDTASAYCSEASIPGRGEQSPPIKIQGREYFFAPPPKKKPTTPKKHK